MEFNGENLETQNSIFNNLFKRVEKVNTRDISSTIKKSLLDEGYSIKGIFSKFKNFKDLINNFKEKIKEFWEKRKKLIIVGGTIGLGVVGYIVFLFL